MVRVRSQNEIILNTLDFLKTAQPNLDTKPGTVSRDIVVDGPSSQISKVYEEINRVSIMQSLRFAVGSDLDEWAKNVGASRKTGSTASGIGLFTFGSIDADIPINKGDIITATNGATFVATSSFVVSSIFISTYRSTAAKYRADLDFVGINDQYAVEVPMQAAASGTSGNISKYALVSTNTPGVSHVTNAVSFGGGQGPEDDATFRNRILSIFSGANTGTSLGYRNAVLGDPAVLDAIVIEPGDPLMTRDGTAVKTNPDGSNTIISEGTGGKVDVIVYGSRLQEYIDSYIYRDLSNKNDPTDIANDFVLGQIVDDAGKTVSRKRIDDIAAGTLPAQPVNNITQVSGTISGSNFIAKNVDSLGIVTGNYELIRDSGAYGGSPFGFDRIHWIDNKISDFAEDDTKGKFNGQDPTSFPDVIEINAAKQNIQVVNENGKVSSSDRSSIQLAHSPITNITRVFNSSTGERYTVANQNPDGSGNINLTGRIVINGSSLPSTSDILQIDYIWIQKFDPSFDFDNRLTNNNPRLVVDSVDWGFSNAVRREQATVAVSGSVKQVTVTHPISSVININTFVSAFGTVTPVNGRQAVIVTQAISNVVSVIRNSDGTELWATGKSDGTFNNQTIFLPTDTAAVYTNSVSVVYNTSDIYTVSGLSGSFDGNVITVSSSSTVLAGTVVECNYIANINTLLPPTPLANLPALRNGNAFNTTSQTNIGCQPVTNWYDIGGSVLQNRRQAPSRIALTLAGSISPGVITLSGTTITGVFSSVITASSVGLKQNLASAIRSALGLTSAQAIPSSVKLIRVTSVEKVETTSSLDVLSVINSFDVKGYHITDNSFVKSEAVSDIHLQTTEFLLPSTANNITNQPSIGDRLRVTFYISKSNDSESVSFSKTGTLYTDKIFAFVESLAISSGFTSGASKVATLTVANLNQPTTGSRYKVTYDYLAPKVNERITIRFNYNRLISDSTMTIENVRPINADILAKAAIAIPVNVTMNIVVTSDFTNSTSIVKQNVQDTITSALNATSLGTILDGSDLVNSAYSVSGVDRARLLAFNKDGSAGMVLSLTAQKNQYFTANNVIINIETR